MHNQRLLSDRKTQTLLEELRNAVRQQTEPELEFTRKDVDGKIKFGKKPPPSSGHLYKFELPLKTVKEIHDFSNAIGKTQDFRKFVAQHLAGVATYVKQLKGSTNAATQKEAYIWATNGLIGRFNMPFYIFFEEAELPEGYTNKPWAMYEKRRRFPMPSWAPNIQKVHEDAVNLLVGKKLAVQ